MCACVYVCVFACIYIYVCVWWKAHYKIVINIIMLHPIFDQNVYSKERRKMNVWHTQLTVSLNTIRYSALFLFSNNWYLQPIYDSCNLVALTATLLANIYREHYIHLFTVSWDLGVNTFCKCSSSDQVASLITEFKMRTNDN